MRCTACGARNADGADWCTQCFTDLRPPPPPPAPPQAEPQAPAPVPAAPTSPTDPGHAPPTEAPSGTPTAPTAGPGAVPGDTGVEFEGERFRRTGEGLDWRCGTCESWNPLEVTTCTVCGTTFTATMKGDAVSDDPPQPTVSENVAILSTLALPGLGHLLMRRHGSGVMRALLFIVWLGGGLLLFVEARNNGQSILPAVPLLIGALVIWMGSVVDAQSLARGGPDVLLTSRNFMWLVLGVVGLLLLTFVAATFGLSDATTPVEAPTGS